MARRNISILFAPRKLEDRKKKKSKPFLDHLQQKRLQVVPVEVSTTQAQPGSSLTGPISNLAAMK
jgi:hypothetical protein